MSTVAETSERDPRETTVSDLESDGGHTTSKPSLSDEPGPSAGHDGFWKRLASAAPVSIGGTDDAPADVEDAKRRYVDVHGDEARLERELEAAMEPPTCSRCGAPSEGLCGSCRADAEVSGPPILEGQEVIR